MPALTMSPITERFVLHWGEMGTRWGVNRTVAQIHALLFVNGAPLAAEDIAETLGVARSNVSNSLRELQNWDLVRITHILGDRRDFYETSSDPWVLMRIIVRERKLREFDPTVSMLEATLAEPSFSKEPADRQQRIRDTYALMSSLGDWTDEMLQLEPSTLSKLLKLGSKIQKFFITATGKK
ncbi:MAG: MarR family transcriptional regulator [Burkholderiales bacterium]|nr:MAG: MarR family transcriptional regulator [Betaproteobacteria bacterium]TAG84662.1 MAG: MarR family transcriptional regulator [Burkholderiales bacterium]